MNRLKLLAARIPLIAALIFVSVNSAFPPPALAQENPGKISFQPSVIPQVTMVYEEYTFRFQYKSFFIRVAPFVIYHGEYYSLKQIIPWIKNNYPQASYSWVLQKLKTSIHYGFNLTQLPQKVADGVDYVGFKLVDLNFPLSWLSLSHRVRKNQNLTEIQLEKAGLTFSFQDLYPYGYSVRAINSSYILIGAVRGRTDLFLDPIVRSGDTMIITGGTKESPIEDVYWEFWNASYTNGWNLAFRNQFGVQFAFNGTLQIGDWETETWVAAEDTQVLFFGTGSTIEIADYGHFRNGKLVDASKKIVSHGCSLYFNTSNSMGLWGDLESEVKFYDTTFQVIQGSGNRRLELWFEGNQTYYGCEFINVWGICTTPDGNSWFHDVRIVEHDGFWLEEPKPTFEDISVFNTTQFAEFYLGSDITITNLYGRNAQECAFIVDGSTGHKNDDCYFINPDLDSWTFSFIPSYTGKVYRQYSFDLTTTWDNSSAIQNCEVWLSYYGQGGGQDFHGYTNSTGQIPSQPITIEHYNYTGGDTPYSYSPFRLKLKYGEVEYIQNFTHPGEPMDLIIALQPPEEAPSQGPFFHAYTVDYGSFSLGIQAPKELHPGFFDYVSNRVPLQIGLRLDNYQIRAREFQLSYELWDHRADELRLNGSEILDVGAGEYQTISLSLMESFSKRADPRNYTLTLTVEVGGKKYRPIEWPIRISHEPWAPLIYTSAFLVGVVGLLCVGYGLYHYWPRIRKEAKIYYG